MLHTARAEQLLQKTVFWPTKKDLLFLGYDIIVRGFLEHSYLLTSTSLKEAIGMAQKIVEKIFVYIEWLPYFPFQCNWGSHLARCVLGFCQYILGQLSKRLSLTDWYWDSSVLHAKGHTYLSAESTNAVPGSKRAVTAKKKTEEIFTHSKNLVLSTFLRLTVSSVRGPENTTKLKIY